MDFIHNALSSGTFYQLQYIAMRKGLHHFSGTYNDTRQSINIYLKALVDGTDPEEIDHEYAMHSIASNSANHVLQLVNLPLQRPDGTRLPHLALPMTVGDFIDEFHHYNMKEKCLLLAQVGQGLQQVHDAGVVHRDVKLENMVIRGEMDGALIDFGSSERVGAYSTPTAYTPGQSAPETGRSYPIIAHPAEDWYAFAKQVSRFVGTTLPRGLSIAASVNLMRDPAKRAGLQPLLYELQNEAGVEIALAAPAVSLVGTH